MSHEEIKGHFSIHGIEIIKINKYAGKPVVHVPVRFASMAVHTPLVTMSDSFTIKWIK